MASDDIFAPPGAKVFSPPIKDEVYANILSEVQRKYSDNAELLRQQFVREMDFLMTNGKAHSAEALEPVIRRWLMTNAELSTGSWITRAIIRNGARPEWDVPALVEGMDPASLSRRANRIMFSSSWDNQRKLQQLTQMVLLEPSNNIGFDAVKQMDPNADPHSWYFQAAGSACGFCKMASRWFMNEAKIRQRSGGWHPHCACRPAFSFKGEPMLDNTQAVDEMARQVQQRLIREQLEEGVERPSVTSAQIFAAPEWRTLTEV